MIIGQLIRQGWENLIDKYSDLACEREDDGSFAFFDSPYDVAGAHIGAPQVAFIEHAVAQPLSFAVERGMAYIGGGESRAYPHDMDAGMQHFGAQGLQPA